MALAAGARLGPYEVVSPLGVGGMGEVYRATDTNLKRQVALKVLPAAVVGDADRLARFQREAEVLAALNHPHIAHIYGVERAAGQTALVMELVEGEDLSQRIARGPIPIEETLAIARQIAGALEAAHESGIIHRDLKPANIKVREDGTVKVLDFGLAKALDHDLPRSSVQDVVSSPTITSPAMTQAGIILGTAAYMAPEQAKGKPATKRSDIWAFGCVLYEMLTGRRAFEGEDISDTLANVLKSDLDWSRLPAATPASIRRLLQRVLVRDHRNRLADIADARLELDAREVPEVRSLVKGERRSRWKVAAVLAAASMVGIAVGFLTGRGSSNIDASNPIRAELPLEVALSGQPGMRLALSPDARRLAFVAPDINGRQLLWVRLLEGGQHQSLPGTEGAAAPFWSPDSRTIGFTSGGKLRRVDAAGGPITAIADAVAAFPGAWSTGGTILFTPRLAGGLYRVSASGGPPAQVTEPRESVVRHAFPSFLPDQRHFVFFSSTINGSSREVYVGDLDGTAPVRLAVSPDAIGPRLAGAWLLYVTGTTLFAQRLSATGTSVESQPVSLTENVEADATGRFGAAFSASNTDVLAFQVSQQAEMQLQWLDRGGKVLSTFGDKLRQRTPVLSGSGAEVAIDRFSAAGETDVWIVDTVSGSARRLTNDPSSDTYPVWSPTADRIIFASRRRGRIDLYIRDVAGPVGSERLLHSDDLDKFPTSWSRDGENLLYQAGGDVWILRVSGDRPPQPFLHTAALERAAQFSPDGHWVAYISNESGRDEVYITAFPEADRSYQISSQGVIAGMVRWRRNELFFMGLDQQLNVATLDLTAARPAVRATEPLFKVKSSDTVLTWWDIAPDGRRVLAALGVEGARPPRLSLIVRWPSALPH